MDVVGISRTIDHAVYTFLNAVAIILWRIDSAIIAMSLFSYNTQDWLTNRNDGGVWQVMDMITGPSGIFGLAVWQIMLTLAIMLYGISRVARPFIRVNAVDLGRMFMFAVFSFVVISSGSALMIDVEEWRSDLGSYMYEEMSSSGSVNIDMPGVTPSNEPLNPPAELDGQAPIRGWEAVSTSYFLVQSEGELNHNIPPEAFRIAYCLYDPNEPIEEQGATNAEGCSPQRAWDEWDVVSTGAITQVWGVDLPISVSIDLPIIQEHPENRELAIRQAQAGVARLALGPVVALYPMIEANISLMLALSAAILYLTLPIVLLFGFFMFTESIATRLLMRFITIIINTIILNGLIALFLLLLINVSVNGSLSAYLGLVGVAVIGGFILARVAAGTLKETLSMAMSSVGGIWLGATTAVMGKEAAAPARAMMGVAKLGATAAVMGAAGASALDLAEGGLHTARSGVRDLEQTNPETANYARKKAGQLPAPLARMAQQGLDTSMISEVDPERVGATIRKTPSRAVTSAGGPTWPAAVGVGGASAALFSERRQQAGSQSRRNGQDGVVSPGQERPAQENVVDRYSQEERLAVWRASRQVAAQDQMGRYRQADGSLTGEGVQAVAGQLDERTARVFRGKQGQRDLAALVTTQQTDSRARGWGAPEARQGRVEAWVRQAYRTQESGQGSQRVTETGQGLFGEELSRSVERAVARRSPTETEQVLNAVRQAAAEVPPEAMLQPDGSLTGEGLQSVRARLDQETEKRFRGRQGERDLAALTAMALQPEITAAPEAFQQATAAAETGAGKRSPGRTVPRELGLDPVAAGPHFSNLNRFAQVSDQAGLSKDQRQQLLAEIKERGQVSAGLREQIQASLDRQEGRGLTMGLTVEDVIASAQALPDTLSGPVRVRLAAQQQLAEDASGPETEPVLKAQAVDRTLHPQRSEEAISAHSAVSPVAAEPARKTSVTGETAPAVDVREVGAAVAAGTTDGVRSRLAEQQQQQVEVPRSEAVPELRARAAESSGQPPQPVEGVVGGGQKSGSPPGEQASGPIVAKYEAEPRVDVPVARLSTGEEETVARAGQHEAGADLTGAQLAGKPGDDEEREVTGIAADFRRDLQGNEVDPDDEEEPDLRAEALKQMAKEAQDRERAADEGEEVEKQQPKERPATGLEPPTVEKFVSQKEAMPAGAEATLLMEEARPDPADEARKLAAELRSQVKAKDGSAEIEKEAVIPKPGTAPPPDKGEMPAETDQNQPDKKEASKNTSKTGDAAEVRTKLVEGQQERVKELAGGGGLASELRRGRVGQEEKEEVVGKKKGQTGGEAGVAEVLGEEVAELGAAKTDTDKPGNTAEPKPDVSLAPHHRPEMGAAQPKTPENPTGPESSQQAPAKKTAKDTLKERSSDRPRPAINADSQTAEPDRPATADAPGGSRAGRADDQPVPASFVEGQPPASAKKKKKAKRSSTNRKGSDGTPGRAASSRQPKSKKEQKSGNPKRPPLKR